MHSAALRDTRGHLDVARTLNRAAVEGYAVERIGDTDLETNICRDLDDGFTSYPRRLARRTGRPMPAADTTKIIWLHLDQHRGKVLVRGRRCGDLVRTSGHAAASHWSHRGRGPVLSIDTVPDLYAAGDHLGLIVRERQADA